MTTHRSSILNPDVVHEWIASDNLTKAQCADKAERGRALLPNVNRYCHQEYPRAVKAVELWTDAAC